MHWLLLATVMAVASTSTGFGAVVLIVASVLGMVGLAAFVYAVFKTKASKISNDLLRDLVGDLKDSLSNEKDKNADLRDEVSHFKEHDYDD